MKTGKWFLALFAVLVLAAAPPAMAQSGGKNTIYNKQSTTTNSGARSATRPAKPLAAVPGKYRTGGNLDDMPFSEYMQYKKNELHDRVARDSQTRSAQTKANVDRIMADSYKDIERQRLAYSGHSGPQRTTASGGRGGGTAPAIAPYVYTPQGGSSGQSSGPFSVFKFNKKKE